jgi:hypothetical protein
MFEPDAWHSLLCPNERAHPHISPPLKAFPEPDILEAAYRVGGWWAAREVVAVYVRGAQDGEQE